MSDREEPLPLLRVWLQHRRSGRYSEAAQHAQEEVVFLRLAGIYQADAAHRCQIGKSLCRFFVFGYSIGGPVAIPKLPNMLKKRLFFFVSQEYTRQTPRTDVRSGRASAASSCLVTA